MQLDRNDGEVKLLIIIEKIIIIIIESIPTIILFQLSSKNDFDHIHAYTHMYIRTSAKTIIFGLARSKLVTLPRNIGNLKSDGYNSSIRKK